MKVKKIVMLIGTLAIVLSLLVSFTACNMSDEEVSNLLSNLTGGLLLSSVSKFTPSTDKTEIEGYIKTATGGFAEVSLPEGTFSATATTGKVEEKDYAELNVEIHATEVTYTQFSTELVSILETAEFVAWNDGYLLEKPVAAIYVTLVSASDSSKDYSLNIRVITAGDFAEIKDTITD